MPPASNEIRERLERLIFIDETAQEWVQDVWDMSPTLGETAARFSQVFDALLDRYPPEQLESLVKALQHTHSEISDRRDLFNP
jgi:hypothetical protein